MIQDVSEEAADIDCSPSLEQILIDLPQTLQEEAPEWRLGKGGSGGSFRIAQIAQRNLCPNWRDTFDLHLGEDDRWTFNNFEVELLNKFWYHCSFG